MVEGIFVEEPAVEVGDKGEPIEGQDLDAANGHHSGARIGHRADRHRAAAADVAVQAKEGVGEQCAGDTCVEAKREHVLIKAGGGRKLSSTRHTDGVGGRLRKHHRRPGRKMPKSQRRRRHGRANVLRPKRFDLQEQLNAFDRRPGECDTASSGGIHVELFSPSKRFDDEVGGSPNEVDKEFFSNFGGHGGPYKDANIRPRTKSPSSPKRARLIRRTQRSLRQRWVSSSTKGHFASAVASVMPMVDFSSRGLRTVMVVAVLSLVRAVPRRVRVVAVRVAVRVAVLVVAVGVVAVRVVAVDAVRVVAVCVRVLGFACRRVGVTCGRCGERRGRRGL